MASRAKPTINAGRFSAAAKYVGVKTETSSDTPAPRSTPRRKSLAAKTAVNGPTIDATATTTRPSGLALGISGNATAAPTPAHTNAPTWTTRRLLTGVLPPAVAGDGPG